MATPHRSQRGLPLLPTKLYSSSTKVPRCYWRSPCTGRTLGVRFPIVSPRSAATLAVEPRQAGRCGRQTAPLTAGFGDIDLLQQAPEGSLFGGLQIPEDRLAFGD
jgi:hypothetical protein